MVSRFLFECSAYFYLSRQRKTNLEEVRDLPFINKNEKVYFYYFVWLIVDCFVRKIFVLTYFGLS